jgi:hypothetical protein
MYFRRIYAAFLGALFLVLPCLSAVAFSCLCEQLISYNVPQTAEVTGSGAARVAATRRARTHNLVSLVCAALDGCRNGYLPRLLEQSQEMEPPRAKGLLKS